jgi:hypothetical protein
VQLAQADREQPVGAQGNAFVEFELLLEALATEPERRPWPAAQRFGFEVADVGRHEGRRFGSGVGQVSEDVEIVERREGLRQVLLDERSAHRASSQAQS